MRAERREQPRHELLALISIRRADATFVMSIRDISRSGVFVETDANAFLRSLRLGESVEMNLFMTDELRNLRLDGEVVRVCAPGSGEVGFAVGYELLPADVWAKVLRMAQLSDTPVAPTPAPG